MSKVNGFAMMLLGMLVCVSAAWALTPQEVSMIANAAERGRDGAQLLLAVAYQNGDGGLKQDDKLAARWFEAAALQGNAYAEQVMGDLYAQGKGVSKSMKVAADWWTKSANRGNVQAQLKLGKMYLNGEGGEKNMEQAEHWLNRASVEGNAEAQYLLARLYLSRTDDKRSRELSNNLLAKSAANGYEDAVKLLHWMEEFGLQVEETFYQRVPDIHQLAQDGDAEAQYQLAIRYETGAGGEKRDYAKAMHWFQQAAGQGHGMAMKSLEHIYRAGLDGVAADPVKAQYWADQIRAGAH